MAKKAATSSKSGKSQSRSGKKAEKAPKKAEQSTSTEQQTKQKTGSAQADAIATQAALKDATDLPTFLRTVGQLSLSDRQLLVEQAIILIEQFYVHLPLKQKMHAVQPLQRLRLLQHQLGQTAPNQLPSELQFHNEMTDIFVSVRDLHTNYLLPVPFSAHTAFLPFLVEEYFDNGQPKYLVSKVASWFEHLTFQPGVEITYWNGVPIARAVQLNADRQAGSNLEARRARGLEALTLRPMFISLPPDEEWVVIGYRTPSGKQLEIRQDWMVAPLSLVNAWLPRDRGTVDDATQGIDIQTSAVQEVKKQLFLPEIVATERKLAKASARTQAAAAQGLDTKLAGILRAQTIEHEGRTYGYLRIYSFNIYPEPFLEEVTRLLRLLPQEGLILDVRGNGGGVILSGECLLQLLTPRRIEPERLEFINTPLTLELCRQNEWLSEWTPSISQSVQTGAVYSNGFPITPVADCNAIGQQYYGPVLLITNALCYSTTDIFAAGFQDHEIGPILGTSGNTGAGGANVWQHSLLLDLLQTSPTSPLKPLPNQAGMRVSIRRTVRVGKRLGTPVEDLGIVPDYRHDLTQNDLLKGNVDLLKRAATILSKLPVYALTIATQAQAAQTLTLTVETKNISRLDVYVSDRPQQSLDVKDGPTTVTIPLPTPEPVIVELQGFASLPTGDQRVAVRRVSSAPN